MYLYPIRGISITIDIEKCIFLSFFKRHQLTYLLHHIRCSHRGGGELILQKKKKKKLIKREAFASLQLKTATEYYSLSSAHKSWNTLSKSPVKIIKPNSYQSGKIQFFDENPESLISSVVHVVNFGDTHPPNFLLHGVISRNLRGWRWTWRFFSRHASMFLKTTGEQSDVLTVIRHQKS